MGSKLARLLQENPPQVPARFSPPFAFGFHASGPVGNILTRIDRVYPPEVNTSMRPITNNWKGMSDGMSYTRVENVCQYLG